MNNIMKNAERIKANINEAFAVLAEKGVTIPEGATSADLAALIAQLPSLKNA